MNLIRKPFRYVFLNATMAIIIINIAVLFIIQMIPKASIFLGLSFPGLMNFYFWQPLTHLFVHGSWRHILFNMLALFFFGIQFEKAVGTKEFLLFYFVCGILDGLISMTIYLFLDVNILLIGASGAIYAVLFAYAVVFPRNIIYIWGIIPVQAPILVLVYAIIEFISQWKSSDAISHIAHLSGFLIAWIYFIVRMGIHPLKIWKENL